MANEILIFDRSYTAAAQLTQYKAVVLNSSGQAAVPAAGADCVGVVQDGNGATATTPGTVASGAIADVRIHGVTKMVVDSGSSVTAGDKIMVTNDGSAKTWTTGNYSIGFAESGGASSTYISVLLLPGGKT